MITGLRKAVTVLIPPVHLSALMNSDNSGRQAGQVGTRGCASQARDALALGASFCTDSVTINMD